jgi:hypothetical protein
VTIRQQIGCCRDEKANCARDGHNYNWHGTTMLFAALATGKLVKASHREHIDVFNASYNETAKPFVWNNFKVHQKQDVSAIYDSGH